MAAADIEARANATSPPALHSLRVEQRKSARTATDQYSFSDDALLAVRGIRSAADQASHGRFQKAKKRRSEKKKRRSPTKGQGETAQKISGELLDITQMI